MQAIRYRITSLSPLLFSSNTGDPNMVATLDYIPGTYLKGFFANEYIKKKGLDREAHKDDIFYKWFLKGELKITNGYITAQNDGRTHIYLPIPLSIQEEKGNEGTAHDLILKNQEIDIQTMLISGYGRLQGQHLYKKNVKKSLNFHHARDREKGSSKEGLIFNYESIDEGQTFEGFIIGEGNDLKAFANILQDGTYYIGRSRNNQYGKIRFEIIKKEPEEFVSEVENLDDISADEVVLTLLSDTIIYNENGFSTTDVADFEKHTGLKVKNAFIRQSDEEGFLSVWRLKTPSETCLKAGSCFLVDIKDGDIDRLKELQKTGIGMRTHEGFGRFVIGLQTEDGSFSVKDYKEDKASKPASDISEEARLLLKDIIKDALLKGQQIQAIKDAKDYLRLPPPSLLSKLEALVKDGKLTEFLTSGIKDTAKAHLEKCRSKDTLLDYLKGYKIDIPQILKNRLDIEKLCGEISYKDSDIESEYGTELKNIYLITLLSTLRKLSKQGGKK